MAILKDAFIPDYRVRLFECLGGMPEIEYVVIHGHAPRSTGHHAAAPPFSFSELAVENRELRIAGRTLVYQPKVRKVVGSEFDAAVIGMELKLLSNVALFARMKVRGQPVLLWGQGSDKRKDEGVAMRVVSDAGSFLRRLAARHADGYIAYTEGGRRDLIDSGVPPSKVFVVVNTLDMEGEIALQREVGKAPDKLVRKQLGLRSDTCVLLFIGRAYREKRLVEFVSMIRELLERQTAGVDIEGVVIGDGPELKRARLEADGLEAIHFIGEVRDRETVARYMHVAAAVVIPGAVGLAVNHAFAHGVPVITRVSPTHGPEFEYLKPGHNSIVTDGDFGDFLSGVAGFVNSRDRQIALSRGAIETRDNLTVAAMAASFHHAVCTTMGLK